MKNARATSAFTIVELLIVIVVIAILATITIVSYNGISLRAKQSAAATAAQQAAKKVMNYATINTDQYPTFLTDAGVSGDSSTNFEYTFDNTAKTYCITATYQGVSYYVSNIVTLPTAGLCSGHTGGGALASGVILQTVTNTNCPTSRTRAVDARDNRTYWIKKLADGKCWMLTNLAYAGGGTNTYNDTRTLTNSPGSTYTVAGYYTLAASNPTTEPTDPSASTDGGATNPQYGYLYNWCGAMGAPISTDPNPTSACSSSTTPAPNASRSVCPANWRLPTGATGETTALNTAINGGSTTTDLGLRNEMLVQYNGSTSGWQGTYTLFWSSTQASSTAAYLFWSTSSSATPNYNSTKSNAYAVRCVAV